MRTSSLVALFALAVLTASVSRCASGNDSHAAGTPAEVWGNNTVTAAALASELNSPQKPVVVCVAPQFLYRSAHIPGSVFHGPTASPAGLDDLRAWAGPLPRSTPIVIYCGCCPMEDCPNLRPAYRALAALGFTRVRVLVLPSNFGTDWVEAGGPVERTE